MRNLWVWIVVVVVSIGGGVWYWQATQPSTFGDIGTEAPAGAIDEAGMQASSTQPAASSTVATGTVIVQ